jgi:hypothetical protein
MRSAKRQCVEKTVGCGEPRSHATEQSRRDRHEAKHFRGNTLFGAAGSKQRDFISLRSFGRLACGVPSSLAKYTAAKRTA